MRMLDLIAQKREGREHSEEELGFIAAASCDGSVPDYQLSAWLMAVCCRGMSERESVAWTRAMTATGRRLGLSKLKKPKVDKHSTGGVGDGISLALAPLLAASGAVVPMMSGRGLGHTGGTLDKLESIPGFKVRRSIPQVLSQLRSIGVCMFGQTAELAPADRKLYPLRDATATVESTPLIVASILSKKLAEDLDALVFDIKCGSGAIFREQRHAVRLSRALVKAAKGLGLPCAGLVTDMEQPLGRAVGNALEMRQAIEVLQGGGSAPDFRQLLLTLGGWMLRLAGRAGSWEQGAERLEGLLRNGAAALRLRQMVRWQGGDPRVVDDPDRVLPRAKLSAVVRARHSGHLSRLDARLVGMAAVELGAGRSTMEDAIDYGAGILLEKKLSDPVRRSEVIARLYASDAPKLRAGAKIFEQAIAIGPRRRPPPLIREVVR